MAKTFRNTQIKRDRRKVLDTLRMWYPGWLSGEEVFEVVLATNPEYDRRYLVKDAHYLNEKGYLKFRHKQGFDIRNVNVKDCEYSLTANGSDVADRIMDDPTLDF